MDADPNYPKAIDDYVRGIMHAEQQRIEWACERAIQDGKYGVKVMRRGGLLISAEPDPEVPYGQLHEHLLRDELFEPYTSDQVLADFIRWYQDHWEQELC